MHFETAHGEGQSTGTSEAVQLLRYDRRHKYRRVSIRAKTPQHQAENQIIRLITLMLGRLKMSVDEYIAAYGEMSEEVFVKQGYRINLKGDVQGRCDTAVLEKAVRECIKDASLPKDALLRHQDAI